MKTITNPLAEVEYERAWGPGGGTHAWGQNWQSAWGWDLLHGEDPMPVRAPFAGVVKSVGQGTPGTRFAGAKVGIQGDLGLSCFLTHLSRATVAYGQRVKPGDIVGYTGQAAGVFHLHFALAKGPYVTWYTRGWDDVRGVDPLPYLDASASLLAAKGPKGYPLYRGNLLAPSKPEPPDGNTLRLAIQTAGERAAGRSGRRWAGWEETEGALRWIAKHGLRPDTTCAIAWRGHVWRGPVDVTNVARNLVNRFL